MDSWLREELAAWGSQGRGEGCYRVTSPVSVRSVCKAPSSTAHSEVQSGLRALAPNTWTWEGPHRWARTRSHRALCWGRMWVLSYRQEPLKAALQNTVLYINKHLRSLCFSDVTVKESVYTELRWLGKTTKTVYVKCFNQRWDLPWQKIALII